MKQIFFLASLFFSLSLTVYAQQTHRGHERIPVEQRAERQTQIMTDSLGLTASQAETIQAINLKYVKAREELMKNKEMDRREKIFDLETLEIKQHKEFKKVLDKEQFKKVKEMEERRKVRRQKMIQERRGGSGNN